MKRHTILLESPSQIRQRVLDQACHLERVGAVLGGHDQDHARLTHDGCPTDRGLRRVHDVGDVAEPQTQRPLADQHGAGDVVRLERLALALKHDALMAVSMNPAPRIPVAFLAAASTSLKPRLYRINWSG